MGASETNGVQPRQARKEVAQQVGYWDSWWPGAESNHRHKDFQSSALPTELPGHLKGEMIHQFIKARSV